MDSTFLACACIPEGRGSSFPRGRPVVSANGGDLLTKKNKNVKRKELTEAEWIRHKLGLPKNATKFDVYGQMHVMMSRADGYVEYIEAYRCDDKQGKIARQSVKIGELQAEVIKESNKAPSDCWGCPEKMKAGLKQRSDGDNDGDKKKEKGTDS